MSHLTRSITACPCGKPHTCPIRTVRIGEGALLCLPAVCEGYRRIRMFTELILVSFHDEYVSTVYQLYLNITGRKNNRKYNRAGVGP